MPRKSQGTGFAESGQHEYGDGPSNQLFERPMPRERIRLGDGGRFVIPASMRAEMGVKPGDILVAHVEDGELRLISPKAALKRVQKHMARYKKPGESVVDEFLAERRAMWGEE